MKPGDVLAFQTHVLDLMKRKDVALLRMLWYGMEPILTAFSITREKWQDAVATAGTNLLDGVRDGQSVFIEAETVKLCNFAGEQLPVNDRMDVDLLPFEVAFVVLDGGLPFRAQGEGRSINGLVSGFVVIRSKTPSDEWCNEYFVFIRYEGDPLTTIRAIGYMLIDGGTRIGNLDTMENPDTVEIINKVRGEGFATFNPRPFLQALWSLMGQPIVASVTERPIDPVSRKARKTLRSGGDVKVLRIRQRVGPEGVGGGPGRAWSSRWVVRGHWRNQACGTGRRERRRVWVDAYVKGPEDLPLRVSSRVYRD